MRTFCLRLVVFLTLVPGSLACGEAILGPDDFIIGVDFDRAADLESSYPDNERPIDALDDDESTKYLNFAKQNSGFIVTPEFGASIVRSMLLTTANDHEERDPTSWAIYGTNDEITSEDNSDGSEEDWILIDSGFVELPEERFDIT